MDAQTMDARQSWSNNGHVAVDWSRVKPGQVVDYVDVEPKICKVKFGDPHWNILVVSPNSESATVERLADNSVRAYMPKVFKWMPTKERLANGQKRMEKMPRPMFPGYLLADLRPGIDDFRVPLNTKGVRDYLWREAVDKYGRPTRQPCILPSGLFDAILDREGERSKKADEDRFSPFKIGQTVKITDGPFRDFVSSVHALDDRGRVEVLLSLFGRKTPTKLESHQLEKV